MLVSNKNHTAKILHRILKKSLFGVPQTLKQTLMSIIDQVKYIKVSPGIGMARVGNSPESFIGPEAPGIPPMPSGKDKKPSEQQYKDSQGRVKPMSARFRVYGYNEAGEAIIEFVHDPSGPNQMSLAWDVHMLNKKAANYAFQGKFGFKSSQLRNPGVQSTLSPDQRTQLIIDPGAKQVSGANITPVELIGTIFQGISQPGEKNIPIPTSNFIESYGASGNTMVEYLEKDVYIGQLETDHAGRLVIVGGRGEAASLTNPATIIQKGPGSYTSGSESGQLNSDPNSNGNLYFNNPGWYDDTAGGSVHASVSFLNSSGATITLTTNDTQTITPSAGAPYTLAPKNKRGWISVAPPKYVPSMRNVVSILDLQLNIFPEADPNAGNIDIAIVGQNGAVNLYDSKTGKARNFNSRTIVDSTGSTSAPALASFNGELYCGVSGSAGNLIASAQDENGTFDFIQVGTNIIRTTVSPALAVFNGLLYYVVVEHQTNKIYVATSSSDGDFSQSTFVEQNLMLATSNGFETTDIATNLSVSLAAYGGNLYLALTDTSGAHYLAVFSSSVINQLNLQPVGQSAPTSTLAPSITVFDGRLYYAFTANDGSSWIDSWNNFAPQIPLDPSSTDTTPKFVYHFKQIRISVLSDQSPAITAFNGKLYYLLSSLPENGGRVLFLGAKAPLLHVVDHKKTVEQEPPFTFEAIIRSTEQSYPTITSFETVSFFRDIYPVLKTVTDYAWVNQPAFNGHGPGTNGDFLRGRYLQGISDTSEANNFARVFVFNLIRPAGWLTNVPPPPMDFPNSIVKGEQTIVPVQKNQRGSLMPHLAGTGGSADENIFNGTEYPNQWLSLTRHQLAKFQKWVNGDFVKGSITVPRPLDAYPLAEQPKMLDFGALDLTVGGGFHPGIELTYYVDLPEYFCEPFRFTDEIMYEGESIGQITPGSLAGYMSVPWHGDFWSCNTDFWAAQRPDIVLNATPRDGDKPLLTPINWFRSTNLNIPEDASSNTKWLHGENPDHFDGNHTTYQTFLKYWSYFGFVVKSGGRDFGEEQRAESERADCLDTAPLCPAVNEGTPRAALTISSDGKLYTLYGQIHQDGAPAVGLQVEAYDKDIIKADDKLGSTTTNAKGEFEISFNKADFANWGFHEKPDIYFKIYDGTRLIKDTTGELLKDADENQEDIRIDL